MKIGRPENGLFDCTHMNKTLRFLLAIACVLPPTTRIRSDNFIDEFTDVSAEHGVGVLKLISNLTAQPVIIRFQDSSYPPLKPNSSTDDFSSTDVALKTGVVFGTAMLAGLIGMAAMKANPQRSLSNMQRRIDSPAEKFTEKVDAEKARLIQEQENKASTDLAKKDTPPPATADTTINARAAAQNKWGNFAENLQKKEDAALALKLNDPNISLEEKKRLQAEDAKRKADRIKAKDRQQKIQAAQTEGGIKNTLIADKINTQNERRNEKSGFSAEINQWKGMTGRNTAEQREDDKAFHLALQTMTDAERKAALQERRQKLELRTAKAEQVDKAKEKADRAKEKAGFWASVRNEGGFNRADGSAMSKTEMTKKVLWERMAGRGETSKKAARTRKEKLGGMAKFAAQGALIGAIPATLVALSEQIGDTPSNIITNLLPFEVPDGKFRCPISKNPLLVGFGSMPLQNFPEGGILQVKRMMGLGAAWLQNPLPTPLSFTLKFKVRTLDGGGAHIILREGLNFSAEAGEDIGFKTKIMIGAFNNTVTAISDAGTIVAQIKNDQYAAAAIPPGIFTPYWLSYDSGLVMLGLGQPGTNVILTWHDPDFDAKVDRIGLSCDKSQVEFSEIYFSPPVTSSLLQKQYMFKSEEITLSPATTWLEKGFREPGRGTVSFKKKGSGPAIVSIALAASDDAPQLKIPVGSKCDEPITVNYKDSTTGQIVEEQIGVVCDPYENSDDEYETYWVSNLYGQFTIGHSQPSTTAGGEKKPAVPGTHLIACVTVPDLATAGTIGFSSDPELDSSSVSVKNITIQPAVELEENIPEGYVERRKFMGNVISTYPFAYQFKQAGQSIEVHDQISGETWYPAATPQQMATYFFNAIIAADGGMTMKEIGSPKNPTKFGMQAGAVILQQTAGLLNTTATQVGQAGVDVASQIITAAASIGLASAAIGINISAGALNAQAKFGFRDQNAYVYKEKVSREKTATESIPPEVQANKTKIEAALAGAKEYKKSIDERFDSSKLTVANVKMAAEGALYLRTLDDRHREQLNFFEQYVTSVRKAISLISHPATLTPGIKTDIARALFYINQMIAMLYSGPTDGPQKTIMTQTIIELLLDAQQNAYLLDPKISDDQKRSKLWASWIQDLAGAALNSGTSQGFSLSPLFGQYLWFNEPLALPASGNGSVYFEAQGIGDIFIGLIDTPGEVRNTEKDLYEIVFGGSNNTKSFLRIKSLGRSVAETSVDTDNNAAVDPMNTEKCWISVKNGTISAGKGGWGTGKLFEWTDPYPLLNVSYIGLSTWNNPVTFSNIHVGPPVEELTPEKITQLLSTTITKTVSAASEAKTNLMKDRFEDLGSDQDALVTDILTQNDFVRNDALAWDALSAPEADQLTYDILQNTLDNNFNGPPPPQKITSNTQATINKKAAEKNVSQPGDQNDQTAAQQKQALASMATGGLGGLFQEMHSLVGSRANKPEKLDKPVHKPDVKKTSTAKQ